MCTASMPMFCNGLSMSRDTELLMDQCKGAHVGRAKGFRPPRSQLARLGSHLKLGMGKGVQF